MVEGRKEKGAHKSRGRVNLLTGEITMPPWDERDPEQRYETKYGKKRPKGTAETFPRITADLANATQLKFVPRVYTVDYSSIMMSAQVAATRVWGWREDMPLGNFLDTVIYYFFKEHGIRLAAYVIEEEEKEEVAS